MPLIKATIAWSTTVPIMNDNKVISSGKGKMRIELAPLSDKKYHIAGEAKKPVCTYRYVPFKVLVGEKETLIWLNFGSLDHRFQLSREVVRDASPNDLDSLIQLIKQREEESKPLLRRHKERGEHDEKKLIRHLEAASRERLSNCDDLENQVWQSQFQALRKRHRRTGSETHSSTKSDPAPSSELTTETQS